MAEILKISVIGATGNVGKETSKVLATRFKGELVLIGRNPEIKRINSRNIGKIHEIFPSKKPLHEAGLAMDRADAECVCVNGNTPKWSKKVLAEVKGTTDFASIRGSGIIIITAGQPRKEGMDRTALLAANQKIIKETFSQIKKNNGNEPVIIVVTNPPDAMAYEAALLAGYPQGKIIGMGGVLDGARKRRVISGALTIPKEWVVQVPVIGEHGENMVFVPELTEIRFPAGSGAFSKTLADMLVSGEIDGFVLKAIEDRTRARGAQIIKNMGTSAFIAPAEAIAKMVELIAANNTNEVVCVSLPMPENRVSIGMPVRLSREGAAIAKDWFAEMHESTLKKFNEAAEAIRKAIAHLRV